jgi:hypothetical protein
VKRLALRLLIASVGISALLGIYTLLAGDFGELEVRILLTSLSVSGASILSMACGVAWERGRLGFLPRAGVLLAIASCSLVVVGIWAEISEEEFWNSVASAAIVATALAHSSLLSLARLEPRFSWSLPCAYVNAFLLAIVLVIVIWTEAESEWVWRGVGVLTVLLSAITILVPVFHRMGRAVDLSVPGVIRFCPSCGAGVTAGESPASCERCGATCRIEFLGT